MARLEHCYDLQIGSRGTRQLIEEETGCTILFGLAIASTITLPVINPDSRIVALHKSTFKPSERGTPV